MRRRFISGAPGRVLLVILLLGWTVSAARGQESSGATWKPRLTSNTFNFDGALQRVAHRLFEPGVGNFLQIEPVYDIQRFDKEAEFEKYKVSSRHAGDLGTFMRMRVYPGNTSIFDLAIQLDKGRLTRVEPIRAVQLEGKAFLGFPAALQKLESHPIQVYGAPLARVFHGLQYLDEVASGEGFSGLSFTASQQEKVRAWVESTRPGPAQGDPMLPFSVTTIKGGELGAETFHKKRAALYFGMVDQEDHRQVLDWLLRYDQERKGRVRTGALLQNLPAEISQYTLRGGALPQYSGEDNDGTIHDLFGVGFMPSVYLYGRDGKFLKRLTPPFESYEALRGSLNEIR